MRSTPIWLLLIVVAVAGGISIVAVFDPTFFFIDDSQSGAFGQWWEIGRRLLDGDWSLVNPRVWQSGNLLAEGAWGIFSPLIWTIGLASHLATDAAVFTTLVKSVFLVVAALGVWLLAREYGANRPLAAAVAVATPLTGFTLYMDGASWANGLIAWCLWPLSWALVRRVARRRGSPILAAVACFGLIGIGYVHATLMLAIAIGGVIIESLIARDRGSAVRGLMIGVCAGLFAIIVHLPAVLISPVTGRATGVWNTGLLTVDLSDLAASAISVGAPQMAFFGTNFPNAPLLYIAWFLPLAALVGWRRLGQVMRRRVALLIVLAIALVGVLLPSDVGPLRFPVRLMPYVSTAVLVILAIGLSRALAPLTRGRRVGVIALLGASAFFAVTAAPHLAKAIAVVAVVGLVALWLAWRLLFERGVPWVRLPKQAASAAAQRAVAGVGMIATTLVLLIPQHYLQPVSPLHEYGTPTSVDGYRQVLDDAVGETMVVGGVRAKDADTEIWNETLVGNLFYVAGANVQNAYSSVYYPGYNGSVCMAYNGSTCADLLDRLFEPRPQTGELLVDLLGVSSVQVVKAVAAPGDLSWLPDDWHVVSDDSFTLLVSRDEPVPGAGGVVWASPGVEVVEVRNDAMGVEFRVDRVPESGGTVAVSRIGWPGYTIDGGTLGDDPVDDFLMPIEVSADAAGTTVTVSYASPGWPLQLLAGAGILVILIGWTFMRVAVAARARGTDRSRRAALRVTSTRS